MDEETLPLEENVVEDAAEQTNDLAAEYESFRESANAKISALEAQMLEKEARISELKATNYDLVMQTGSETNEVAEAAAVEEEKLTIPEIEEMIKED